MADTTHRALSARCVFKKKWRECVCFDNLAGYYADLYILVHAQGCTLAYWDAHRSPLFAVNLFRAQEFVQLISA